MAENPCELFCSKPKVLRNGAGFSYAGRNPPGSIPGLAKDALLGNPVNNAFQITGLKG